MPRLSRDYLQKCFRQFKDFCEGHSPLYATISPRIADEPRILDLASHAQKRQPPVNLLFAAVHFLLLGGREHRLAAFYPSVGGAEAPDDAWPVFVDFCRRCSAEIIELVSTHRVQTNEVGRCGLLMPAFGMVHTDLERALHLIEIGSSAGLNLLFDRYRYEYDDGRTCGPVSRAVIRTEIRGSGNIAIPDLPPPVSDRVGVDIEPVDVTDERATRWVEALIWADEIDRIKLHRSARTIARENPPRLVTGDARDLLPDLVADVPHDAVPCIYHSHAIYQMTKDWRASLERQLDELGRDRDLAHVSLEWLGDEPGPQLRLTTWSDGARREQHLADCHHHGRWLRPLGQG